METQWKIAQIDKNEGQTLAQALSESSHTAARRKMLREARPWKLRGTLNSSELKESNSISSRELRTL